MPKRISEVINTATRDLEREGAFDGFVDIDSRLYVDPALLEKSGAPELSGAYSHFEDYFRDVLRLLLAAKREQKSDPMFREAVERLTFPESEFTALGFSQGHTSGSGIGPGIAENIAATARKIAAAGRKDPHIFELVGVIEDNVGADRISDMTISIVLPYLLAYSERVATNLGAKTTKVPSVDGNTYQVPLDPEADEAILLIPRDVLQTLLTAESWDDRDVICQQNRQLRSEVNDRIGNTWKEATEKINKETLRRTLLSVPEVFDDLLEQYKQKDRSPYDFASDPKGVVVWHDLSKRVAKNHPVSLDVDRVTPDNILSVVTTICEHFARLIEANGLFKLFYDKQGNRRHERFAQLLFFGIADSYCAAHNLDLSPEVDSGRGPVDFKMSKGYDARVNVEVKYTSNTSLKKGYTNQLPVYNEAEKTKHSVYLIIITTEVSNQLEAIEKIYQDTKNEGKRAPEICVADGRYKPSASNV